MVVKRNMRKRFLSSFYRDCMFCAASPACLLLHHQYGFFKSPRSSSCVKDNKETRGRKDRIRSVLSLEGGYYGRDVKATMV